MSDRELRRGKWEEDEKEGPCLPIDPQDDSTEAIVREVDNENVKPDCSCLGILLPSLLLSISKKKSRSQINFWKIAWQLIILSSSFNGLLPFATSSGGQVKKSLQDIAFIPTSGQQRHDSPLFYALPS